MKIKATVTESLELLKESRDLFLMLSLVDKSDSSMNMVDKIDLFLKNNKCS